MNKLPDGWHETQLKKRSNNNKKCVYCGNKKDDMDHVPPKSLFTSNSKVGEMMTVPSCRKCNKYYSEIGDDDRFRNIIAKYCQNESDVAKELLEGKITRSGRRRPDLIKQESARYILKEQTSKSGIYLGNKKEKLPFTTEEEQCIERMAERISKCLYFKYTKEIAPNSHINKILTVKEIQDTAPIFLEALKAAPWQASTNASVFRHKSIGSSPQINHLISMFVFYNKFTLIVIFGSTE